MKEDKFMFQNKSRRTKVSGILYLDNIYIQDQIFIKGQTLKVIYSKSRYYIENEVGSLQSSESAFRINHSK